MNAEELQQELSDLKARVLADKEVVSKLKEENDTLVQKLQAAESQDSSSVKPPSREHIVYVPKEKKCAVFSGGSSALFYEWQDEISATVCYRSYSEPEKAAYIYEHLGGEAKQEIKYRTKAEKSNPARVLEILQEIYGQPQSLTKLQRQFFDRRQREGESVREYSHALMAIMEEINHCNVKETWCSDFVLRDQFAENVCDVALRRELRKTIRQNSTISFFELRKEALQWGEETESGVERRRRVLGSCEKVEVTTVEASVVTAAVEAKPDPMLAKVLEMLQKQQLLIDDLSQKVSGTGQASGSGRADTRRWQPRYDAAGQPICFKCQKAGHIARFCVTPRQSRTQDPVPPTVPAAGADGAVQMLEHQGNCPPLR